MSGRLHDLLHELAEGQQPATLAPGTYGRARRRRRREAALGAAGATTVVGLLALGGVQLVGDPDPAPAGPPEPSAMPRVVHEVPAWVAERDDGGYAWDPAFAADGLRVGETAAVLSVNGGAVLAVSAVDGRHRGLDLPGYDEDSSFRFDASVMSLSPDGTRLAYTWNPRAVSDEAAPLGAPSGVRIADLTTGEVTDHPVDGGERAYGVFATGFGWSPTGRWLAYDVRVVTSPQGNAGPRHWVERLDTASDDSVRAAGLRVDEPAVAVDDGGRVAATNGSLLLWDGARTRGLGGDPRTWSGAWSADGRLAVGSSPGARVSVGGADRPFSPVRLERGPRYAGDPRVRVLAWTSPREVAVVRSIDAPGAPATEVHLVDVAGGRERSVVRVEGAVDAQELSLATDLLRRPTVDRPAPDWPTDWGAVAQRAVLGGLVLAGVLLAVVSVRRLRRRW